MNRKNARGIGGGWASNALRRLVRNSRSVRLTGGG
jgi:hypothetical protein